MRIRLKQPYRDQAVIISIAGESDSFLEAMLLERGVVVTASIDATDFRERRALPPCDLVIVYASMDCPSPVRFIEELSAASSQPVLLICQGDDGSDVSAAIDSGAHAVLAMGVASDRLSNALISAKAIHSQIEGYRKRASEALDALERRKLVERAKGILMETRGLSESAAFSHLQRLSMDRNEALHEISRSVISAKALLG